MADLLIRTSDRGPRPEDTKDGDIICAFSERRIRCCHAQEICNPKRASRNGDGLIQLGAISRDFYELTHEYRFERVSLTEVRRTNLITLDEEVIGASPNASGEAMDVVEFVARRRLKSDNPIFGSDGSEVWYGGRKDFTNSKMTQVWAAIETKTHLRENDFRRWPFGRLEVRHYLPMRIDPISDTVAEQLVEPDLDMTDPPTIVQARKYQVIWAALGLDTTTMNRIRDRSEVVDLRDTMFLRAVVVQEKTRGR